MAFSVGLPWHDGEVQMHRLLRVPEQDNPTSSMLTPQAAGLLQRAPLLAIGTLDSENQPWTTLWGGDPGFARPLGSSIVGIRMLVDGKHDPVVETLLGGRVDGEVVKEQGNGRMVGGLTIDLETRKRVKIYGRMVAGALSIEEEGDAGTGQIQLVVRVEQSLGNCPKYLNRKTITPALPSPKLLSDGSTLTSDAVTLLGKADLFFISSSNSVHDMDTNHRGGHPGFVRILRNSPEETSIVWPEYSGNRLYQTLGNLQTTPLAGLVFPDFEIGDVLYLTGRTEILIGQAAAAIIPRSNLAVKLTVTATRFVHAGLAFRGRAGESSPYNPTVRYLVTERSALSASKTSSTTNTATLLSQTRLTPTISRFRFSLTNPISSSPWRPGQWIALDFSSELHMGYSHMRDDDPRSLNDDFVRTFTVSSPPPPRLLEGKERWDDEFEITIRRVGPVTDFLFKQSGNRGLEVPVLGIGGEFEIQPDKGEVSEGLICFVAGGVGITPLLAHLGNIDLKRLRLFWTLRVDDTGLVLDTIERHPDLASSIRLFVTAAKEEGGPRQQEEDLQKMRDAGVEVTLRRIDKADLLSADVAEVGTWYVCLGTGLRKEVLEWLEGKEVVYEDFNF